jgi:hypothetical protein
MKWQSVIPHSLALLLWAVAALAQPSGSGTATVIERAVLAASCSQAHVATAIAAATAGDTVLVPAGSCAWTTNVSLTSAIHLRGASAASTTISVSTPDTSVIYISTDNAEVSHLTLSGGARIQVSSGNDWRIHDMVFTNASASFTALFVRSTSTTSQSRGLIDSSTFTNGRVLVHGYPGVGTGDLTGTTHWSSALGLGTNEAIYIEDNTFTFTEFYNVFDCEYSGRIVFRHNTVTDSYLETHSVQGHIRACRKWEVYENTIQQVTDSVYRPMFFRAGTGVIYNNTVTGTYGVGTIHFDNVRTFTDIGGEVGQCDGTSDWDGNSDASGWPCRDQIGRGIDASSWPASAPYPAQTLDAAYIWDNTLNGSALGVTVISGSETDHIKPNRDYYVNVGAKPGYTAYTYPHPLRAQ